MIATARTVGMDFAAITDHRVYQSSLEAIRWAKEVAVDMVLFPGEEVNFDLGLGHILSINAERAVSDRYDYEDREDPPDTEGAVKQAELVVEQVRTRYAEDLAGLEIPEETDSRLYGYLYGIARDIRDAGGLSVLAHPYWRSRGVLDLVRSTYQAAEKTGLFDAVELLGDCSPEDMILALAGSEERSDPPTLGNSDAHTADHVGERYTIVFSRDLSGPSILDAIRARRTVACSATGTPPVLLASRAALVEYGYFLIGQFFPRHDALCATLGGIYGCQLNGAARELGAAADGLKKRVKELYRSCFEF
jgi:predicted metal-dependent phosphoesterase TrpH